MTRWASLPGFYACVCARMHPDAEYMLALLSEDASTRRSWPVKPTGACCTTTWSPSAPSDLKR